MKWLFAPLLAALLLGVSGFTDSLGSATETSLRLAELTEEAPRTTSEAAEGVEVLPRVAELTAQQATALGALADALEGSARRLSDLEAGLLEQVGTIATLSDGLKEVEPLISCLRGRLHSLARASVPIPSTLDAITEELRRVVTAQRKSVRHLESLNRKLAALGVIATVTGVESPPVPSGGSGSGADVASPSGRSC